MCFVRVLNARATRDDIYYNFIVIIHSVIIRFNDDNNDNDDVVYEKIKMSHIEFFCSATTSYHVALLWLVFFVGITKTRTIEF